MDTYHQKKSQRKAKQKPKKRRRIFSPTEGQIQQPKLKKDAKVIKESNIGQKQKGRLFTVSVAVPGSILSNAQSPELRTYLAGQVARALAVFHVDEVIVFDESGKAKTESTNGTFGGVHRTTDPNVLLARILQYLECPQYLRKCFFPKHSDLQYAGVLNPLDTPHHMRMDDNKPYREGVVLDRPVKEGCGSFVNVGLRKEVRIDRSLKPGVRVTVRMSDISNPGAKFFKGIVVSPSTPRTEEGLYWGYNVRLAFSFGAVFTQSPYEEGYDITVGTSERGTSVQDLQLPKFRHLLVVFGGLKGLEASLESDETLPVSDPSLLFHHYINTCPGQGSGTIRTEEALLITLSALRPVIEQGAQWSYSWNILHNTDK